MNNRKRMAVLLMAGVLSVPQGGSILAQAAEEPETATAAESLSTAKTSNGLVKKKGKYYYYKSGKMLKNRWVTVKKKNIIWEQTERLRPAGIRSVPKPTILVPPA